MLKALRKSTLKQRESREEKEGRQLKTIKKKKSKSSITKAKEERRAKLDSLQREIEANQVVIEEGISNLSSIQEWSDNSDSSSSSETSDTVFESPVSSPRTSQLGSGVSLLWDNQVDLKSPLKDTSDLLDTTFGFSGDRESGSSPPPALSRERSVSVSVNRASYLCDETGEILTLQPVCRSLNRVLDNNPGPSGASGLISQDSFLERNLQAREVENLRIIHESEESSADEKNADEDSELLEPEENNSVKMDETVYQGKVQALKKSYRRVQNKIKSYTAEDVTVVDKDEYKEHLKSIRKKYDEFIEEVNTVIDDLDEEIETLRVDELNKIIDDATGALKKNENEVKNKVAQLLAEYEENRPLSKKEQKDAELNVLKMLKRIGFIKEKSVAIKNKILKVKKAAEMTDNEVREHIIESKEWEKSVKELVSSREKAEEDLVGLDVEANEITDLKENVQNAVDILASKIGSLKMEDKTRGLFTAVSKNLSRENVVFPEAFAGGLGENVFKFKDKFMQAIHDSQVREKDQVEVLRKHLTGEAKKLVGDHHKTLSSAMEALMDYFGNTSNIWEKCKVNIKKKLGGNFSECWGFYGEQKRVLAIAAAIEFLREASELAETYPELTTEVYHDSTFKLLKEMFPLDYYEKFNDVVKEKNITSKKKIENLMEFLERRKNSAIQGVEDMNNKKREISRKPFGGGNPYKTTTTFRGKVPRDYRGGDDKKCYFCGGNDCNKFWDGLGCLELYQLQTREERTNWLKAHRLCFNCGRSYINGPPRQGQYSQHICQWFGKGKLSTQCTEDDCWIAAATCKKHKNNISKELRSWLGDAKIDVKNLAQAILHGFSTNSKKLDIETHNSCCEKKDKDIVSTIPVSKITKMEREKLQRGEMSRPMKDDELVDFFQEDVKKVSKKAPEIKSIPEGEPVFIMNVFKGATRPITAFIDSGCNCWVAKMGIPENELFSCKLSSGPIPMGVASAITVKAEAEWASLLPLADGGYQVVRGLTLPEVTQETPSINMQEVFTALKKKYNRTQSIQKFKVPKTISGKVDMIIGIKYANVYPELVHQFPNGLAVYKSKLLPVVPGDVACIGGPVEALEGLEGVYGGHTLGYLTQLTLAMKTCKPRLEFFPEYKQIDADIPGVHELLEDDEMLDNENQDDTDDEKKKKQKIAVALTVNNEEEDVIVSTKKKKKKKKGIEKKVTEFVNLNIMCQECGDQINNDVVVQSVTVQGEIKKFMKYQEAGLDTSYRCPKCRGCDDCIKGTGFERISLKQEAEQELIKTSVIIDEVKGRPMAYLPFTLDPKKNLNDNSFAAMKRLGNVCRKYGKDSKIKNEINAAFDKLKKKGHIKFYEDLSDDQRMNLVKETGYTIPWDVVWKESSLSTPARTVYDASSKTSSGYSLNDILATGIPDLAKLLDVLLDWQIGPIAFVGDVSQFYCSVGLVEESWPYQKILLREDLNPNGKLLKAVIVSAIFGVCSSGGQSEEAIKKFCEMIKTNYPMVVKLLLKSRYVDDILKSLKNKHDALDLIKATEENLKKINMNIKGWGISGEDPPEQMSDDGASIGFSGLTWFPKIDCFKLNISSLHFGKKKRGKHSSDLDFYDPNKHSSMEEFLKDKVVTRRKCTSVVARLYDNYGKLEPLKLRCKDDLRKLIYENPEWDDPISSAKLVRWTENFKMIEECRGLLYNRCLVPKDAVSLKASFWILCDAADGGIMVAAYARFPLPGNKWSCQHLLAKSLLAPDSWTIPKKELQALTVAANVKIIIERSLEDWIDQIFIGGDSEIALAWTIYENVKLNVFHRNRVNNIRSKVSLDQLHHVQGSENCADTGTRPDSITLQSILPGSEWLGGKEWMKKSHEEAVKQGIIKSVLDIKLSNEAKKVMKEGIIFDQFEADDTKVAVVKINLIDVKKVAEREAFSNYIFPPLKRSFRPTVRIISLVLLAVRRFKEGALFAKIKAGKAKKEELDNIQPKKVKFSVFEIVSAEEPKNNVLNDNFVSMFNIDGVQCHGTGVWKSNTTKSKSARSKKKKKTVLVRLTDEDLSQGLEYLFKKATQEIIQFENRKEIEKLGVLKDGIYYCNSRILESQDLKTVGCLAESLDIETFTGIKFSVPIVSKHSPLAISLAIHLHYIVNHHKGVESNYRMSLQHARILQGRQLFKEIGDDCIFCKKLRLKYVRQLMGPLSQNQLCISPIFYFTYIDMWGPLSVYCPGYEKRTRGRKQEYKVYMMVMGCVVTGAVNCQIIEKKDTEAVLDGLTRFFCETSVPKICYPDQDGALMKALNEGEISILDLQGRLHRERGILFETCLPQGHYQHGRIERRIKMLQESLERSNIRLTASATATGWQTIAKVIENEVNSIPLGYLHHQGSLNPLMRVLCPSLLKNGTYSDRAPKGIFTIPDSITGTMENIVTIYNMWFQLWNTTYLPLVMDRPKWHIEEENLQTNDLVYFKLTDSKLSADWKVGKVEYVKIGRDGKVREVGIAFKNMDEDGDWKHSLVERPVRSVVKLMNIEDTSIIEDMKKIQDEVKIILQKHTPVLDEESVDEEIEDDDGLDYKRESVDDNKDQNKESDVKKPKTTGRKRKTELEELLENKKFEISRGERRKAFRKHKFYAPTKDDEKDSLLYTNTVLAFDKTEPMHVKQEIGVRTATIFSGLTDLLGGRGLHGAGQGGRELVGAVGDVTCTERIDTFCNDSIYLI